MSKSGRPLAELSEEVRYQIKNELKESTPHDWFTKQSEELIGKKSRINCHYIHIWSIIRKWGFKQRKYQERYVNTSFKEVKGDFKKGRPDICD
jgi:putative transposase